MTSKQMTVEVGSIDKSLMFVQYEGVPTKDAATRKQLRQQIMQHVGRKRRKAGLITPKRLLQFSLDVPDDFMSSTKAMSLEVDDKDTSYKRHCGILATQSPIDSSPQHKLSLDRLGISSFDPFARYPFDPDDQAQELIWTGQCLPFTTLPSTFRLRETKCKHQTQAPCLLSQS